jgi:hypothetical protein
MGIPSTSLSRRQVAKWRIHRATLRRRDGDGWTTVFDNEPCSVKESSGMSGAQTGNLLSSGSLGGITWRVSFDLGVPSILNGDVITVTRRDGSVIPDMQVNHVRSTGLEVERVVFCNRESSAAAQTMLTFARYHQEDGTEELHGPYPAQVNWERVETTSPGDLMIGRQMGEARILDDTANVQVGDDIMELAGGQVVARFTDEPGVIVLRIVRDAGYGLV